MQKVLPKNVELYPLKISIQAIITQSRIKETVSSTELTVSVVIFLI